MGKESQLHKALRDYWKETKRMQRERDEQLEIKYKKESTGESFKEFKHNIKLKDKNLLNH
jgi:hypothetical protein